MPLTAVCVIAAHKDFPAVCQAAQTEGCSGTRSQYSVGGRIVLDSLHLSLESIQSLVFYTSWPAMSDNQDTETFSGECGETQVGVQEASQIATYVLRASTD